MSKNEDSGLGCLVVIAVVLGMGALSSFSDGEAGTGMLLLFGAGLFGVLSANAMSKGSRSPDRSPAYIPPRQPPASGAPTQRRSSPNQLMVSVDVETKTIQGTQLNLLVFKTRGPLSTSRSIMQPCFEARIVDVTDGSEASVHRVFTLIDDQQEDDSIEFRMQTVLPDALPAGAGPVDWVSIGATPIDALIFPLSGSRKLKVVLTVLDLTTSRPISSAEVVWFHDVERGYLEAEEEEGDAQAASLKLAMVMAAADGSVDEEEVDVIKEWGEKSVKALPSSQMNERREVLNTALREATGMIRAKKIPELETEAVGVLLGLDERRFMWEAYELCLQVLKADDEAHPEEMARLTALAKKLDLDEAKVRVLTDRHISEVEFTLGGGDSADDQILGITGDMAPEDIRKHLNKLYKKHQARSTHDNPDVSGKAKEWLNRIATARVRHLG